MKAVILDGQSVNPGDLSWDKLKDIVELEVFDNTSKEQLFDRIKDCDAVFTNKVIIPTEMLPDLPKLKYIGVMATGFNTIDLEGTRKAGITVCNIPSYSTDSVAELTYAMIFDYFFHIREHSVEVHNGKWCKSKHFCYTSYQIHELASKTIGIVGYGNIGQKVALVAKAMGMTVLFYNRSKKSEENGKQVSLEELFKKSDIISLHAPLNEDSRHMVNEESIKTMKDGVVIVNTARGPLVDEDAMAKALKSHKVAGYLTDVMSKEPPLEDNPLIGCENCTITPHIAWQSYEARQRLIDILTDNYKHFLDNNIINCVNS